jgi:two-component system chemotaxis response regulator CheY
MITLDDDLVQSYLAESKEHLAMMETSLLAMELAGSQIDEALVNRVFRALHSIKLGAGLFDWANVRELAQQMEHAMTLVRSRQMVPTPNRVTVLLRSTDTLRDLIDSPGESNDADISAVMAALAGLFADGAAPVAPRRRGPVQILLAEDDFTSRLVLQTFLSRHGDCHIAVNGREAVEAFRAGLNEGRRYDLICMDIMMPEMDGGEAVRQIRAMEEAQGILSTDGAKIVMTTAVNQIHEVARCFSDLCDAYLVKPIELAQLLNYMKSYDLVP